MLMANDIKLAVLEEIVQADVVENVEIAFAILLPEVLVVQADTKPVMVD